LFGGNREANDLDARSTLQRELRGDIRKTQMPTYTAKT